MSGQAVLIPGKAANRPASKNSDGSQQHRIAQARDGCNERSAAPPIHRRPGLAVKLRWRLKSRNDQQDPGAKPGVTVVGVWRHTFLHAQNLA